MRILLSFLFLFLFATTSFSGEVDDIIPYVLQVDSRVGIDIKVRLKTLSETYFDDFHVTYTTHPSGYLNVQFAINKYTKNGERKYFYEDENYEHLGLTQHLQRYYDSMDNYIGIFEDVKLMILLAIYYDGYEYVNRRKFNLNKLSQKTQDFVKEVMDLYRYTKKEKEKK